MFLINELGYSSDIGEKDVYSLSDEDYVDWYSEDSHEEIDISCCLPSESYAKYKGRTVKLNKPFRTPGESKKFAVYVKNKSGKVIIVRFGDPNMEIKKDDPERRKSFRARHKCDQKKDKTTAGYWACAAW